MARQRQMIPHYARFGLTPAQFQMLTVINRLRGERIAQRRLGQELYVSFHAASEAVSTTAASEN